MLIESQNFRVNMSFEALNLHPGILKAIKAAGYVTPTPIQQQGIPIIQSGRDLRASAQTGTGKTASFLLPAINRLTVPSPIPGKGPRVLILVPTRELAMQVAEEAAKYSRFLSKTKTVCIYGGAPYPIQNRELSRPYEILVATPGRLIDHMERGNINFSRVEMFVLDEADRMLDMGFIKPVEKIASATPKQKQTLLFSATLKGSVMQLSKKLLQDPVELIIDAEHAKHENIDQRLIHVDDLNHKNKILDHLLSDPTLNQAIVFTATKRHADLLVDQLYDRGYSAAALHGDMNQRQRTRTMSKMHAGQVRILVATDVAARGIDVQTISHVINFDLPQNEEDYVHRIGRTGRAGANGTALSFATHQEMNFVQQIEKFTGQKIALHTIPGLEAKKTGEVRKGPKQPQRRSKNFYMSSKSRRGAFRGS
jgi:superfamily II DNA/RNA helicase